MSPSSSCSSRTSIDGSQTGLLDEKYEYGQRHNYDREEKQSPAEKCRPSSAFAVLSPGTYSRYVCRLLTQMFSILIPSFLYRRPQQLHQNAASHNLVAPTAFLDGMRGLAAFVVFICHLTYGTFDISHAWGANPDPDTLSPEAYKNFLRRPVVRLLYSGPPMVAIFFVISGYALSYKPLKQMRSRGQQRREQLMTTMSSSIFRRGLRLFLPCFTSTLLVVVLAQLGLYKVTDAFARQMRAVREDHCYTQPDMWLQLTDWAQQMLIFVDVFNWSLFAGSIELDRHLWTIPAEFRCSLALFLTHIMVARMSSSLRISTFTALILWGLSWDRWELCPFWAGAIIAELDLIQLSSTLTLPSSSTTTTTTSTGTNETKSQPWKLTHLREILYTATFIISLFLLSYPDAAGHATPGYKTLTTLIPANFTEKHRFWPTVGALMIVWSSCNLPTLRNRVFCTPPLQYLGKISFPLYVVHGPIIHTLGYLILPHTPAHETPETMRRFELDFLKSSLIIMLAVIWAADVFLRVVDTPCVNLTRRLELVFFKD